MHGTPAQLTPRPPDRLHAADRVRRGPIAGVFVDRWPLPATLVSSDLIRAVLALLLIPDRRVWHVLSCWRPLRVGVLRPGPDRHHPVGGADRRADPANALMQIAFMGSRIVGPATAARSSPRSRRTSATSSTSRASSCRRRSSGRSRSAAGGAADAGRVVEEPHPQDLDRHGGRGGGSSSTIRRFCSSCCAMAAGLFNIGCFGPLISITCATRCTRARGCSASSAARSASGC